MSLQILNAHTGDKATADPVALRSFDDFKAWLAKVSSVPAKNQILLTATGKQAKFQALRAETEVFLYNRKVITPSTTLDDSPPIPTWSSPPPSALQAAPVPTSAQNEAHALHSLFEARKEWASQVVQKSKALASVADKHFDAVTTIQRGLGVAADNLQNHVRTLESKFSEAQQWAKQAAEEQDEVLHSFKTTLAQLSSLPAKPGFGPFLTKLNMNISPPSNAGTLPSGELTLESFADPVKTSNSADTIASSQRSMVDRLAGLEVSVTEVSAEAAAVTKDVQELQTESIIDSSNAAWQLLEEIEVAAKKLASDFDHALSLPTSSKSTSQMSKMALLQSRNYLPSLEEYFKEMQDLVELAVEQRNSVALKSLKSMQNIARVESSFAQVNSNLMNLDLSNDIEQAFDYVSLLSQLPFVYGALLIEAVRRQEWSDRLRRESATLAEDIAEYREEEERRRKKWYKSLSHLISDDANSTRALNFEINLQAPDDQWPDANRDDISNYLQALRTLQAIEDIVEELSEAAKDLDNPTKKQARKAKGFKMGSFHESNPGRSSFLLRDNDDVRALRDGKSRVEEELKTQKSRVRKLEDLLYRQGQSGRTNSGNIFQLPDVHGFNSPALEQGSPKPEDSSSRKTSLTSRPSLDGSKPSDDQFLSRRIAALEAELHQERQKRSTLEIEAQSKKDDHARIRSEVEETRSTKKDLMENMEAQQLEFAEERKLLEDQVKEYKIRLEELEDEIDRVLGSRDNEKTNTEAKLRALESALADTKTKMGRSEDIKVDYLKSLHGVHARLGPGRSTPESTVHLVEEIEELAEKVSRQVNELNHALDSSTADKEILQRSLEAKEHDVIDAERKILSLEEEFTSLKNEHAAEKAKNESVMAELEDGRSQLRTLRAKFAEGETGSEALRQRVEEEASRASKLATELAEAKSHVNSLDVELSKLQRRHQKDQLEATTNSERWEQRTSRDRELTNRLVTINEELVRLLESVGLSIVNRDGSLAIQRASKLASQSASASTTTFTDPSGIVPVDAESISPEAQSVQWMHAGTADEEEKLFNEFYAKVTSFSLHTFSEAIIKLRRDVEWTGKKWKQEARNYRDKFHRAQSEGHDKIAFKSFKEGDLALFLPTRNQATRPWAAFNIGAPHFFLRETDAHKLRNREWLVARISKIEERVVDLSKTMTSTAQFDNASKANSSSLNQARSSETRGNASPDDDNPFELSDGLRWYLLDASEEKGGAPATPGLSKSTVASVNVDVKGSIRMKKSEKGHDASGKLNKSLESRRSSNNSKRGSISGMPEDNIIPGSIPRSSSGTHLRPGSRSSAGTGSNTAAIGTSASHANTNIQQHHSPDEARREQLFGP